MRSSSGAARPPSPRRAIAVNGAGRASYLQGHVRSAHAPLDRGAIRGVPGRAHRGRALGRAEDGARGPPGASERGAAPSRVEGPSRPRLRRRGAPTRPRGGRRRDRSSSSRMPAPTTCASSSTASRSTRPVSSSSRSPWPGRIAEVHRRGVIHRDVCPMNFVLGEHPTLVDFETATATPAFTQAPESARRAGRDARLHRAGADRPHEPRRRPPRGPLRARRHLLRDADRCAPVLRARPAGAPARARRAPPAHARRRERERADRSVQHRRQAPLEDARVALPERRGARGGPGRGAQRAGARRARSRLRARPPRRPVRAPDRRQPVRTREGASGAPGDASTASRPVGAEVVLVAGPAGIGKSALVHQVRELAGADAGGSRARAISSRATFPTPPSSTRSAAFVRETLHQPADRVAALRDRVRSALAPNGRVLTESVPELQQLIGEQPPVVEVGPVEAENRFHARRSSRLVEGARRAGDAARAVPREPPVGGSRLAEAPRRDRDGA